MTLPQPFKNITIALSTVRVRSTRVARLEIRSFLLDLYVHVQHILVPTEREDMFSTSTSVPYQLTSTYRYTRTWYKYLPGTVTFPVEIFCCVAQQVRNIFICVIYSSSQHSYSSTKRAKSVKESAVFHLNTSILSFVTFISDFTSIQEYEHCRIFKTIWVSVDLIMMQGEIEREILIWLHSCKERLR